jgi:hypothetical protein
MLDSDWISTHTGGVTFREILAGALVALACWLSLVLVFA